MRKSIKKKKVVEAIVDTEIICDVCKNEMFVGECYDCKAEFVALGCHERFDICSGCWYNTVKPWFKSFKTKK